MEFSASVSIFITFICVLLGVAFFTLLERKGLGYFQVRKGPNKVGLGGLPQPLADAAKLFTKELVKPTFANRLPYFLAPVLSLILALLLWQLYPLEQSCSYFFWGVLFFMCVSSLNVYGLLLAGWSSNSKYALIGAIRAVAQTISYEISLALILLFVLFLCKSFSLMEIKNSFGSVWLLFLLTPVAVIWIITCVAETNRAPFDFAEGESELVSGFNVEYGGGGFALIFMAEYSNILIMSLFISVLFFGGGSLVFLENGLAFAKDLILSTKILFFAFFFVWVRATFPRFRYDKLMDLTWKSFLPFSLCCLVLVGSLVSMISFTGKKCSVIMALFLSEFTEVVNFIISAF